MHNSASGSKQDNKILLKIFNKIFEEKYGLRGKIMKPCKKCDQTLILYFE